jgi:hypothetical protein
LRERKQDSLQHLRVTSEHLVTKKQTIAKQVDGSCARQILSLRPLKATHALRIRALLPEKETTVSHLSIMELDRQSATILPERAALGVFHGVPNIKAKNVAVATQLYIKGSGDKNTATAVQIIAIG